MNFHKLMSASCVKEGYSILDKWHPVSKLDTIDNTTEDFEGAKRTYKARNVVLQIDAVQDL